MRNIPKAPPKPAVTTKPPEPKPIVAGSRNPVRDAIIAARKVVVLPPKNAPRIHGVADVLNDRANPLSRARVFGVSSEPESAPAKVLLPIPERVFQLATDMSKKQILAQRGLGQRPPLKEVIFHLLLQARGGLKVSEIIDKAKALYGSLKIDPPNFTQDEARYVYDLLRADSYYGFQEA